MLNSIKKYSKSFFFKLLVGIIILPFLFWGMGDVFSGGSQNVVAKIDSKKISTQDFSNYLRLLNLSEKEIRNLPNTDLINKILSEYIGRKVLGLELENLNIHISDTSLKDIITNDKTFFKNNKFSRTEYEKFLITSNITAPIFESNIAEQEKKRQLLSFLSDGIKIPNFLIQNEFNKENQIKTIKYIDLKNFYDKPINEKILKEQYEKNKDSFVEIFKKIRYSEITPIAIIGTNDYNKNYFDKINEIENKTLDNLSFEQIAKEYNLKVKNLDFINYKMENLSGEKVQNLDKSLSDQLFKIQRLKTVNLLNLKEKFYLAEVLEENKKNKKFDNPDVKKTLKAQIKIREKIQGNTKIAKDISNNLFDENKMISFAKSNGLQIASITLSNLKDNEIFSSAIIKRIFEAEDKEINLITDNFLKNNFVILIENTEYNELKKNDPKFKDYKMKAKLRLANSIYNYYDLSLNSKYKVEINNKTLDRLKTSF